MRLAILGATGQTGQQVVEQALDAGHRVKILFRNPNKVKVKHDNSENMEGLEVDIFSVESLANGMEGCDAVISCLGAKPTLCSRVRLLGDSMVCIIGAMRSCGITRLIAMSATCTRSSPGEGCYIACCVRGVGRRTLSADQATMEDYLYDTANDLQWTVVKSPDLQDKPLDGRKPATYEGEYVPDALQDIPRAHVARFMLDQLTDNTWHNKAVAIGLLKESSRLLL